MGLHERRRLELIKQRIYDISDILEYITEVERGILQFSGPKLMQRLELHKNSQQKNGKQSGVQGMGQENTHPRNSSP